MEDGHRPHGVGGAEWRDHSDRAAQGRGQAGSPCACLTTRLLLLASALYDYAQALNELQSRHFRMMKTSNGRVVQKPGEAPLHSPQQLCALSEVAKQKPDLAPAETPLHTPCLALVVSWLCPRPSPQPCPGSLSKPQGPRVGPTLALEMDGVVPRAQGVFLGTLCWPSWRAQPWARCARRPLVGKAQG